MGSEGGDLHSSMWQVKMFRRDTCAELRSLANENVGMPFSADGEQFRQVPLGSWHEDIDSNRCGLLRLRLRWLGSIKPVVNANREAAKAEIRDKGTEEGRCRECNLMLRRLKGLRERNEWMPVPGTYLGGEERTHDRLLVAHGSASQCFTEVISASGVEAR